MHDTHFVQISKTRRELCYEEAHDLFRKRAQAFEVDWKERDEVRGKDAEQRWTYSAGHHQASGPGRKSSFHRPGRHSVD